MVDIRTTKTFHKSNVSSRSTKLKFSHWSHEMQMNMKHLGTRDEELDQPIPLAN